MLAEETGNNIDQVSKDTERDYWLNAAEAKEYGLISKIIEKRDDI